MDSSHQSVEEVGGRGGSLYNIKATSDSEIYIYISSCRSDAIRISASCVSLNLPRVQMTPKLSVLNALGSMVFKIPRLSLRDAVHTVDTHLTVTPCSMSRLRSPDPNAKSIHKVVCPLTGDQSIEACSAHPPPAFLKGFLSCP